MRSYERNLGNIECYFDGGHEIVAADLAHSFELPLYAHRAFLKDPRLGQMLVACFSAGRFMVGEAQHESASKLLKNLLEKNNSKKQLLSAHQISLEERVDFEGYMVSYPSKEVVLLVYHQNGYFDRMVHFNAEKGECFYASQKVGVFIGSSEIPKSCWEYPELDLSDDPNERLSMMIERQIKA
jgi:hypothetical protein